MGNIHLLFWLGWCVTDGSEAVAGGCVAGGSVVGAWVMGGRVEGAVVVSMVEAVVVLVGAVLFVVAMVSFSEESPDVSSAVRFENTTSCGSEHNVVIVYTALVY